MLKSYFNSANSTTGGVALGSAAQNVEVFTLLVGNPLTSANIWLYDESNVGNVTNTTGLVAKLTLPGTLATGQLPFTIDLTDRYGHGVILASGGTVAIDQAIQLTVMWGYAQAAGGGGEAGA